MLWRGPTPLLVFAQDEGGDTNKPPIMHFLMAPHVQRVPDVLVGDPALTPTLNTNKSDELLLTPGPSPCLPAGRLHGEGGDLRRRDVYYFSKDTLRMVQQEGHVALKFFSGSLNGRLHSFIELLVPLSVHEKGKG